MTHLSENKHIKSLRNSLVIKAIARVFHSTHLICCNHAANLNFFFFFVATPFIATSINTFFKGSTTASFDSKRFSNFDGWIAAYYYPEHYSLYLSYSFCLIYLSITTVIYILGDRFKFHLLNMTLPKLTFLESAPIVGFAPAKHNTNINIPLFYMLIISVAIPWTAVLLLIVPVWNILKNCTLRSSIAGLTLFATLFYLFPPIFQLQVLYNDEALKLPSDIVMDDGVTINSIDLVNKIKLNQTLDYTHSPIIQCNSTIKNNALRPSLNHQYVKGIPGIQEECIYEDKTVFYERLPGSLDIVAARHLSFSLRQTYDFFENIAHHHFQLIYPMKAYLAGVDPREINSPYGNSYILISEILRLTGNVNYSSFLATVHILALLYFCIGIICFKAITKSYEKAFLATLLLASPIILLGYVTTLTGLGYQPIRRFFDVIIICLLFLYFKKPTIGQAVFLHLIAFLAIFNDIFFGLTIGLAVTATFIFEAISNNTKRGKSTAAFSILFLASATFVSLYFRAPNPYAESFLAGVWGFPLSDKRIFLIFFGVGLGLFTLLKTKKLFNHWEFMTLLCIFAYGCLSLFYYLVIPNYGHFYISIIPFLLFGFFFVVFIQKSFSLGFVPNKLLFFGVILLASYAGLTYARDYLQQHHANSNFVTHQWTNGFLNHQSKTDPTLILEAIEMVERYEHSQHVHIISEFDALIVAGTTKLSGMLHWDLKSFLIGSTSAARQIEKLLSDKPDVLFVDRCIECDPSYYTWGEYRPVAPDIYEARLEENIKRMTALKNLFKEVKNDYELIDQRGLLSVFKLKR